VAQPGDQDRNGVEQFLINKYQGDGARYLTADCNNDGGIDLSDVICLLGYLFQSDPETAYSGNPSDARSCFWKSCLLAVLWFDVFGRCAIFRYFVIGGGGTLG